MKLYRHFIKATYKCTSNFSYQRQKWPQYCSARFQKG